MLSKDRFIEIMRTLERRFKFWNDLENLLKAELEEARLFDFRLDEIVVELLEQALGDDGCIRFCAYERDFLKAYKKGDIKSKDGTDVELSCWGDLYDFLRGEG
jgi:hypothetical protein